MTSEQDHTLHISEVAARTGIAEPTLRMWESRHGFPVPERTGSGHRRYRLADVQAIEEVCRLRADGLALRAAIARVQAHEAREEPSLHRIVRRRSGLTPLVLPKRSLVRMSHAIEDECALQEGPVVFAAAFQAERHLVRSLDRWRDICRSARACVVFAEPGDPPARELAAPGGPQVVPLEASDAMTREWMVAACGPEVAGCLTAWERPGQARTKDGERRFECVWSAERALVLELLGACAVRAEAAGRQDLADGLRAAEDATPRSDDLQAAQALTNRIVGYLAGVAR